MQLDEMTQQNAALVEEATAASKSMADQSQALSDVMSKFEVGVVHAAPPRSVRSRRARTAVRPPIRKPIKPMIKHKPASGDVHAPAAARPKVGRRRRFRLEAVLNA